MTAEQLRKISVIDPISPAIERVKVMLFTPFDLRKWFVIGFCAWLAYLGSGGGPPTFNFNFNFSNRQHQSGFQPDEFFLQAKDFILDNLPWVIIGATMVVIIMIILWLLITWLSSRGRFMFLHCVALNKAEVKIPWHKFRQQGNSLFLFRIVLTLIASGIMFLLGLIGFFFILVARSGGTAKLVPILLLLAIAIPIFIIVGIVFLLIHKFTNDFVAPIMLLRSINCTTAWREFLTLLLNNKARFALYILFQILIVMAISTIGAAIACIFSCILLGLTCGIACCFMIIPVLSIPFTYIMAVLLLPLSVFKRAYSLCYFRQFGPQFDVFSPEIAEPEPFEST